ncbi:MAG: pyridoxal-dependent decarboxylase, partial [Candidatus Brocadiia bacterium]
MRDVFGYMLGPKAENLDLFRQLVEEAMLDHAFWRRNYHPEDMSLIDADIRMDTHYQRFVNRMRDGLFEFLGEAKAGVPFFSPRYIAHMNTDLLIPAMVGYFGAMLYNSNNVAEESSPATARFEVRVSKMLLKMVGYDSERGWGYLTSGGTTANIYSMWVVRNLKTYPLALRCMVAFKKVKDACAVKAGFLKAEASLTGREIEAIGREAIEAVAGLTLSTPKGDGKKPLKDMTGWELANIPIRDLKRLRQDCVDAVAARLQMNKGADVLLDELVKPFEIRILGTLAFADAIRETFPNEKELRSLKCSFYAPLNHHYSWPKAGDVLGLGKDSLRGVKHRSGFDMDIDDLCRLIAEDLSGEPARWPLAVCSTFGTTEEGALDDLAKIQLKLDDLRRERGVNLWHHVDACYGGYLASMIRKPDGSPEPVTADEMKKWLHECAIGVGLDEGTADNLIEMSEKGGDWLTWDSF